MGDRTKTSDRPPAQQKPSGGDNRGASRGRSDVSQPKGSRSYTDAQLKDKPGGSNWKSERGKHTSGAEKAARKDVKDATGKDVKIAGKKVEHHHHSGVSESKKAGLNPKVAGERERTTPLHSRRDAKNYGTTGDKPKMPKSDQRTHHNTISKMDKAEQARTARAMGAKGDTPKLPKGPEGRRGLVDASATSKWRTPATVDQAERAKQTWKRDAPKTTPKADAPKTTPKVDAPKTTPKVDAPKTTPKVDAPKTTPRVDAPKTTPRVDAPKTTPKVDTPKLPKGDVPKVPGGVGKGLDLVGKAGRLGRALGIVGNVVGTGKEIAEHVGRHAPERLPEGARIELTKPHDSVPFWRTQSGYSVEKTNGEVIYRDSQGNQVSHDEAIRNSPETSYDKTLPEA